MKRRCNNPADKNYPSYGGRGITVSDEWMSFDAFLRDMGEQPTGMTIERVDNNKGYEPNNCVWADYKKQARNRRNTIYVTIKGEEVSLPDAADMLGIAYEEARKFYRKFGSDFDKLSQ